MDGDGICPLLGLGFMGGVLLSASGSDDIASWLREDGVLHNNTSCSCEEVQTLDDVTSCSCEDFCCVLFTNPFLFFPFCGPST